MRVSSSPKRFFVFSVVFLFLAVTFLSAQITKDIFAGLKARSIGPARSSGKKAM